MKQKTKQISNKDLVIHSIKKYPGLRFFELKKQTGLVNGVLQHHIEMHKKLKKWCPGRGARKLMIEVLRVLNPPKCFIYKHFGGFSR